MPVGTVSSSSSQQQAGAIIRAGEQLATTPQALKSGKGKTYYHMAPGARFVMPDGLEIIFMGGQLTTDNPEVIAELDRIVNKPTSMIYTKQEALVAAAATLTQQVAKDAADTAGKTPE
jgi:hypothetical protein